MQYFLLIFLSALFRSSRFNLVMSVFILQLSFSTQAAAYEIKVGGTGAGLGIMQLLGEAFTKVQKDAVVKVMPSMGSSGGIKAVQAGAIDIGISSRSLDATEASKLSEYLIGKTPFVLITHSRNTYKDISTRQLVDFYKGNALSWPDGQLLRLVLRPLKEIDNDLLTKFSPEMGSAVAAALERKGMIVAFTDQDAADTVEKQPGSLGASTLVLVLSEKREIKPLAYNGVMPSLKTLKDGSYPYYKQLNLVTLAKPNSETGKFIAFIKSTAGQNIIANNGLLAVAP